MKKPIIWYVPGSGGMWVSYLIWCVKHGQVISGAFEHFEFPNLQQKRPDYYSYLEFVEHTDDPSTADIVLGSDRAWMNFYLNLVKKKNFEQDWQGTNFFMHNLQAQDIKFNLDWCDIWENPKKFVQDLAQLSGCQLQYNQHARTAIEQYRQSCVWIDPSWHNNNRRILLPKHCRAASDQIKTSAFWPS